MVFLKKQFTKKFKFKLKFAYFKDPTQRKNKLYNPAKQSEQDGYEVEIKPEDLDDVGCYFFKDPDDPEKPLAFVAHVVQVRNWSAGSTNVLNFDFIGTYYDFDSAVDGRHDDGKSDDYNSYDIGLFIAKGITSFH